VATRTISVAGGNFNSTSTWDEGAVPVAGDAVVARAGGTSGNLTVNVASACATFVMTNYTGTLTFDSTLTLTSTCTFVTGMTVAGDGGDADLQRHRHPHQRRQDADVRADSGHRDVYAR
jgi:hypothetical protein